MASTVHPLVARTWCHHDRDGKFEHRTLHLRNLVKGSLDLGEANRQGAAPNGKAMLSAPMRFFEENSAILCCPKCGGDVAIAQDAITCRRCVQPFTVENDIPMLFWPTEFEPNKTDVTEIVKSFYEKTPFPNYDDCDSAGRLIEKAERSGFVKLLGEQIPLGTRILEVGCGTGQLTNFLGTLNRTVIGTDICLNSLRLGQAFKAKNAISGSHFLQMNLFRPVFKPETFDLVYCTGVLHHTGDPFGGFQSISRLVRPNGYIVLGLYHRFGRILNDIRRWIIQIAGDRAALVDPRLRKTTDLREAQREAWFADQYKHPHESKHTITQVTSWFERSGFRVLKSVPKTRMFARFDPDEKLFRPELTGNPLERRLVELGMTFTGSKEGGYFMIIGNKGAQMASGDRAGSPRRAGE
jgi:SAM-dependent methyltransferase